MSRAIRTLLTLAVFATLGTTVFAQATSGRISGAVTDAQGGLLPGATVTVTEVNTNYTRTATTDAQGAYVFVNLPLGTYTVSAELTGFKKGVALRLRAGGGRPRHRELHARGRRPQRDGRGHGRERDREHGLRRDRAHGRPPAGPEPGPERSQLPPAHHPHPRRARPQPERPRHHDGPRDQHLGQRQPHQRDPADRRRRLQHGLGLEQQPDQQRRRRLHRGGRDQDRELLRRVRPQLRRRGQRRDALGLERVPRQRIRVPPQRRARREQLLQQLPQRPPVRPEVQRLRRRPRRTDHQGQALLLRRRRVEADRPLLQPLAADPAHDRDAGRELQPPHHAAARPAHRAALPRQHHPGEPDHSRRPGLRQLLHADVADRELLHRHPDRQQRALPGGEPLPLAPGDDAPRLQHQQRAPADRARDARPLHADRSLRDLHRRQPPDGPDGPQPPRLEPPAEPQLDDLEHAAERDQVQLLGQQPVHRPRRRQVGSLHVRLPVPAGLPRRRHLRGLDPGGRDLGLRGLAEREQRAHLPDQGLRRSPTP